MRPNLKITFTDVLFAHQQYRLYTANQYDGAYNLEITGPFYRL
jgi:hypothetical protein